MSGIEIMHAYAFQNMFCSLTCTYTCGKAFCVYLPATDGVKQLVHLGKAKRQRLMNDAGVNDPLHRIPPSHTDRGFASSGNCFVPSCVPSCVPNVKQSLPY